MGGQDVQEPGSWAREACKQQMVKFLVLKVMQIHGLCLLNKVTNDYPPSTADGLLHYASHGTCLYLAHRLVSQFEKR